MNKGIIKCNYNAISPPSLLPQVRRSEVLIKITNVGQRIVRVQTSIYSSQIFSRILYLNIFTHRHNQSHISWFEWAVQDIELDCHEGTQDYHTLYSAS